MSCTVGFFVRFFSVSSNSKLLSWWNSFRRTKEIFWKIIDKVLTWILTALRYKLNIFINIFNSYILPVKRNRRWLVDDAMELTALRSASKSSLSSSSSSLSSPRYSLSGDNWSMLGMGDEFEVLVKFSSSDSISLSSSKKESIWKRSFKTYSWFTSLFW